MKEVIDFLGGNERLMDGLVAIIILITTFLASKLLAKLEIAVFRRFTKKTKTELDDRILDVLARGTRKIVWLVGFYFILHSLDSLLSENLMRYGDDLIYVLTVLIFAYILSRTLQFGLDWYSSRWGKSVKGGVRDEFGPLFKRLIVIVVYTIAVIFILNHFNQNVSSIIVSLGVGSLAVALAAKDTLANMIAGFMIMTDRPFRIGDRILLESGEKGDVHDIGLRSTKILTFDNTLIVVPNQQIINEKVTNLSYPDPQIRVSVELGVAYGSDLDRVKEILIDICNAHPKVLENPPPKVWFVEFGNSSLNLKLVCRIAKWRDQWEVSEELRMEINRAFEKEGVEIPFPQRVVTMKKEGG
jgi:small-conductance mechanosensitive channel